LQECHLWLKKTAHLLEQRRAPATGDQYSHEQEYLRIYEASREVAVKNNETPGMGRDGLVGQQMKLEETIDTALADFDHKI